MHLQSLKLLRQKVKEKMHLQENSMFVIVVFPDHTHLLFLTFDLGVKATRNVAQYPLHHVNYSDTKFEVATSNNVGRDIFYKKIHYLIVDLDLSHTKCCPVPSTACDLFSYKG